MPDFFGVRTDTCVHCEGGVVLVRSGIVRDETGKIIKRFTGPESHFENFIAAVRSGKREDLHADVLEGHRSTAVTHAGNISYRLGRKATDSDIRKQVAETPLFADMWDRMAKHLQAHEINLDAETVTLGPWLDVDRDNECFKSDAEANNLVAGTYRAPFTLSEIS